jgi:hypothetical protein
MLKPTNTYVPPLRIARRLAREDLTAQEDLTAPDAISIHSAEQMIKAAVTLQIRLRQVLDALDADDEAVAR